jgi:hypothetical protein
MEDTVQKGVKRIPYGITNFGRLRRNNEYYVDKTRFVEEIERSNAFFFFIRPRRFGKTLLISMLEHYYDLNTKDQFDELFGDLYIGQHPTPERNSYLIVHLNFSLVNGSLGNYQEALDQHCMEQFLLTCNLYERYLPENAAVELRTRKGAVAQLNYLCSICVKAHLQLYLFIDEYDHFTNDILSNPDRLQDYEGETHGEGYLRQFFNAVKAGTTQAIARCFVTGVSPVTLDDLTSGFNIGANYSTNVKFNAMVGFTEREVREMLEYFASVYTFHHTTDELIRLMAPYYDHYCFAKQLYGKETMYNSNMVLYFLYNYIDYGGAVPENMIDANIRTDYEKLRMLIRKDKEHDPDTSIIQQIVNQGYILGDINTHFPARHIVKSDNFVSLLFYLGMLTYGGMEEGETQLIIPNNVVREQMYAFLLDMYEEMDLSFRNDTRRAKESALAYKGAWRPYFEFIADCLKQCASTRDIQKGEALIHGFTLAMLYQSRFYFPQSEPDCNGGYADILLSPRIDNYPDMLHSYVIELKYVKPSEPDSVIARKRQEAMEQLNRYAEARHAKELARGTQLHKLVVVFHGADMKVCEECE